MRRSPMPRLRRLLPLLLLAPVAGCDSGSEGTFTEQVVVNGVLYAHEPLPAIRLYRTVPIDVAFSYARHGVADADLRVSLLAEDGAVEATWAYAHVATDADARGLYVPPPGAPAVRPARTYRLEADVPGTGLVRSETRLPGDFEVLAVSADTAVYNSLPLPTVEISRSAYPGRQAVYQFALRALEPECGLTPFLADLFDEDDDLEDFVEGASPLLFEGNYNITGETVTVPLPWAFVGFFGTTRFTFHAYDDNLYDFIRTLQTQSGGTTLSPGEIPNVRDRVENGTGLFGGAVRRDVLLYVQPRPQDLQQNGGTAACGAPA